MKVDVIKISQNSPDDLTGLIHAIQQQKINPRHIVAIMGKTEGNGCVNDFTRGFAVATLKSYLRDLIGESVNRIAFVMSGGTEGVLSPHITIFTRQEDELDGPSRRGLVLGLCHTRDFSVDEIGTLTMVRVVAEGVNEAIADAGLAPEDVHFVQIKCPLITSSSQNETAIAPDSYKSMAYSRGASALGVAVALGEINIEQLSEADICTNYELYSAVASTSAGVELNNCEILVLGNSPHSHSDYLIEHRVMNHALDATAVKQAIASAQECIDFEAVDLTKVVNIFAKAEADPSGRVLGCRHTMLDDSDINHTRMARAVVGTVVASVAKNPMVYVSGGSEHQGPSGGGPVAAICKRR
ncbi:MAG: ring-opening amidohydrolase [Cyanobacteria bacterium P01_D01_bin.123]